MTPDRRAPAAAQAADDARFIQMALTLGRRGLGNTWPNPSVGAVVVRHEEDGPVVVGRGWTQPGGRPHAEIEALRRAGEAARGATLYTTLEPCSHFGQTPPCADAIIAAGVKRVVSAIEDPNPEVAGAGHGRLRANGVSVMVGLGAEQARRAHAGHFRRTRDGRPHITLKLAVSADEKVGVTGAGPLTITGERARAVVHMTRAMNDAVLTGIGTALEDDPLLTCRLPGMERRSPVRVVFDSTLRLPLHSRLAQTAREVPLWIAAGPRAPAEREQALRAVGADVLRADLRGRRVDLEALLRLLAERGITRLMVEAGPIVSASFLVDDLVDEALLFRAPDAIGGQGLDAFAGLPLSALTASARLVSRGIEPLGPDTLERFERI